MATYDQVKLIEKYARLAVQSFHSLSVIGRVYSVDRYISLKLVLFIQ